MEVSICTEQRCRDLVCSVLDDARGHFKEVMAQAESLIQEWDDFTQHLETKQVHKKSTCLALIACTVLISAACLIGWMRVHDLEAVPDRTL